MPSLILLPFLAVLMSVLLAGAWSVARRPGKAGWTDAIWSYAVGVGAVTGALLVDSEAPDARRYAVAALAAFWSLRLGTHILRRNLKDADDPRYAKLKAQWGDKADVRLFVFLQVQALCAFVLVLPVIAAATNPAPFPAWSDLAGIALGLIAIGGEGLADRQLRDFAADPANKGKLAEVGLWRFSRHPNYFFEWLFWWAFVLVALGPDFSIGWRWIALAGPALMYWLLVHASGIPPNERHMVASRGDAYRAYQRRVNAFFPGPRNV